LTDPAGSYVCTWEFVTWSTINCIGTIWLCMFPSKYKGWGFSWFGTKNVGIVCMAFEYALALCTQVSPLIRVAGQFIFPFASRKQDWKKHWYFPSLTRLHSTTVSEWNFVLDSALERAWKITWMEWWECRKLSFVLCLFYSITSKISGGKKIWDTLQKQSAHKLNCSRLLLGINAC